MSQLPNEIIVYPADIYLAPTDEAWPDVDATPSGNWTLLGTTGNENLAEDGVRIRKETTHQLHFTLGSTHVKKISLTQEVLVISATLIDLDPDQLTKVINHTAISDVAPGEGTSGYEQIGLSTNLDLTEKRMLIRLPVSSMDVDMNSQFEIERVVALGSPELIFSKADMAGWACEWYALEDPDASADDQKYGRWIAQTDEPT